MSEQEYSESGAPVYRYGDKAESKFTIPVHVDEKQTAMIEKHIEKYIGKIENVFHEVVSDTVHIDINVIPPTPERNVYTLITTGMSDLPMTVDEEDPAGDELRYAELMICLPPDWPIDTSDLSVKSDHEHTWPVQVLKFLARFPHTYDTYLAMGHTIPNGDPAEAIADNVDFTGFILIPPMLVSEEFSQLEISEDKVINFYGICPVYQEEMNLKLKKGADKLFDLFEQNRVSELVDIERPCVVKKSRWKFF